MIINIFHIEIKILLITTTSTTTNSTQADITEIFSFGLFL